MFRVDDNFVVDATMKGNAARFINHSCDVSTTWFLFSNFFLLIVAVWHILCCSSFQF